MVIPESGRRITANFVSRTVNFAVPGANSSCLWAYVAAKLRRVRKAPVEGGIFREGLSAIAHANAGSAATTTITTAAAAAARTETQAKMMGIKGGRNLK
jgi:hypothetical protein